MTITLLPRNTNLWLRNMNLHQKPTKILSNMIMNYLKIQSSFFTNTSKNLAFSLEYFMQTKFRISISFPVYLREFPFLKSYTVNLRNFLSTGAATMQMTSSRSTWKTVSPRTQTSDGTFLCLSKYLTVVSPCWDFTTCKKCEEINLHV